MIRLSVIAIAAASMLSVGAVRAGEVVHPLAASADLSVFEQISPEMSEEMFEHDLNDAWLGMPVFGPNGTTVGVVLDAPVDEYGEVAEILVGQVNLYDRDIEADEPEALVFPIERVELLEDHVALLPLETELVAQIVD